MPEDDCYLFGLTGVESVQLSAQLSGFAALEGLRRSHEIMDFCGIGQERYRTVETYSTGMRQKLRFAQAIVHDPPVLILDDALSAVDSVTETAILHELRQYMRGRSSILISHRVSAVRDADVIFVLEDGRLVEQGRHRELLELDGVYKRLLERQLLSEEIEREEALISRTAS